ncbi:MAG TPA: YhjD/YihY/BrkB family envelope integrity protein [Gaiella sp.]
MEPTQQEHAQDIAPAAAPKRPGGRLKVWSDTARTDWQRLSDRAETERRQHPSVDAVYDMVDRDAEVGGAIIACALAYRLFIWLLPVALVVVAGLGIAADASSGSPEEAAASLGFEGLVSNSIANAAESPNRWYALLVGIPILLWATRSLLRALVGAHRLVWGDVRAGAAKPTIVRSLELLALLVGFSLVSALASAVRAWSTGPGVLVTFVAILPYAGLWLLLSLRLPHRDAPWQALVPGAFVYGAGTEVLHAVIAYAITPWALAKQGTYGALGLAAALLLSLFLISRLVVGSAVVNATLWERRSRRGPLHVDAGA